MLTLSHPQNTFASKVRDYILIPLDNYTLKIVSNRKRPRQGQRKNQFSDNEIFPISILLAQLIKVAI